MALSDLWYVLLGIQRIKSSPRTIADGQPRVRCVFLELRAVNGQPGLDGVIADGKSRTHSVWLSTRR